MASQSSSSRGSSSNGSTGRRRTRRRDEEEGRGGEKTDAHRHFLQSLMSKRVMRKGEAKKTAKDLHKLYSSDEPPAFHDFIQVINVDLKNLGFEVKMAKLEHDGSEWVGLANTISDDAMKKAPGLGLAELEFFSDCLQLIVSEESGTASSNALLSLAGNLRRKMTGKAAQELLISLTNDKWFSEVSRGHYCMGPRCFIELLPFLSEIVGQTIEECQLCSNSVVMGEKCDNCDIKLHRYCIVQLSKRGQVKCPQCHTEWEGDIPSLET